MKKRDIFIIAGILVLAAAVFVGGKLFGLFGGGGESGYVSVTVKNREWVKLPLNEPTEYTVTQSDGNKNTITVDEKGDVYVSYSTCDNQDCVQQGTITHDNVETRVLMNQIICLPNSVVVTVYYD